MFHTFIGTALELKDLFDGGPTQGVMEIARGAVSDLEKKVWKELASLTIPENRVEREAILQLCDILQQDMEMLPRNFPTLDQDDVSCREGYYLVLT